MSDAFNNDPLSGARTAFNPLGQMVQQFRQNFGPRPAPQAPPNLEQQAQLDQGQGQGQRRPPPPVDSQAFRWSNSYLPPGSEYPRQRIYEPFRPASIERPYHQWGREEQFPKLPQPFEFGPLAHGLSQYFGQNGSPDVARIAMMMGPHASEFLQGLAQGRMQAAQQSKEQLALHIAQLKERMEEQQYVYADTLGEYHVLSKSGDPNKMTGLLDAFARDAQSIGDYGKPGTVGDMIAAGATANDVVEFLKGRDNRLRDLQKLKTSMDEDTREEARLGLQAQPASTAETYSGVHLPSDQPAEAAPAAAPAAPAGGPAPAAPSAPKLAGDPGATGTTSPDITLVPGEGGTMVPATTPGTGADDPRGATPIDSLKHSIMSGGKPPPTEWIKSHQPEFNEAVDRSLEANATLDKIVGTPPKDRSKILPMVRALDPDMARDAELVLGYKDPASGGVSGTGGSPGTPSGQYSNRLRQIVSLIDPKWNQGNYQQQQIFRHSRTMDVLWRTKDLAPMATQIAGDLRQMEGELKKRGLSSTSINLEGFLQLVGDDPNFVGLRQDFNAYNNAYNTVVTAGHNTLGGVRMQEKGIDPYAPIATYRRVLQGHMVGVQGMIEGARDRWESNGGKRDELPAFDTDNGRRDAAIISNISKWDMNTGAMPYDPANKDNDIIVKKPGPWGPQGRYYWTGADPQNRDDPANWKRAE